MELTQAQAKIAIDPHRFRVICCGRRFGKTTLAIDQMKARAVALPGRIVYIAPTFQQARDIAWTQLKSDCAAAAININETRLEIKLPTQNGGESLIVLRGWESIETLRGQQFDLVVLDEVASMRNFWLAWQEVIRPTLTDTAGEAIFISTPKGFNHFYELFSKDPGQPKVADIEQDADFKSYHFSTYSNPHVPKAEIDKAKMELTEDRFAQEYMADFRKTEGLVYKEFDRSMHIYEDRAKKAKRTRNTQIAAIVKTIGGVDFGFHNPACALTIAKDTDGVYWVSEEWYKTQQTDAQVADYVAALKWNEAYPDPESASGVEELRRRRVNVREVVKNKDSVRNGISAVRELFKSNRLFIHKDCINLIEELESYVYPDKRPDHNFDENPVKENDHAVDALRYPLMMDTARGSGSRVHVSRPQNYKGFNRAGKTQRRWPGQI